MATYRVQHLTRYVYQERVPLCLNLAHLLPRQVDSQRWMSSQLEITPTPAMRTDRSDYFGNRITCFSIQQPHKELRVLSTGQVEVTPFANVQPPLSFSKPWEDVANAFHSSTGLHGVWTDRPYELEAFQFLFSSPYIEWDDDVHAFAKESFSPNRSILDTLLDLMRRIYRGFKYDPKSTTISTTLPEIMKTRAGVCQDFAHLLIGCLRSMGLPARYISGYLLTSPPPGKPRLVGADASHAWASAFIPGFGWLDLDPTNDLIPSEKHITIAWGRDYGDVSPVSGVVLGGGKHAVHVSVDVAPL